jgi:hypothetical protein
MRNLIICGNRTFAQWLPQRLKLSPPEKSGSAGETDRDYGGIGRKKVVQQSSAERGVTPQTQPRKIGARNIFTKPKTNHA